MAQLYLYAVIGDRETVERIAKAGPTHAPDGTPLLAWGDLVEFDDTLHMDRMMLHGRAMGAAMCRAFRQRATAAQAAPAATPKQET